MPLKIVTILKGFDGDGNPVTECRPQAVVLSDGDTIAWRSFEGKHEVKIENDGRPKPLEQEPWTGEQGKVSNKPGSITADAKNGFYPALATLTLPDDTEIEPGGAIVIIKRGA